MDENEVKVEEVQTEAVKEEKVAAPALNEKKNSYGGLFSVALLSIILPGIVGLVVGIIALVKSSKLRKSVDHSLVTASFVMSIVGLVVSALSVIIFALSASLIAEVLRMAIYDCFYCWY